MKTELHPGRIERREDLCAARDTMEAQLDSLSEMGKMESLRLQMAMDRMSKIISTISNLLKKIRLVTPLPRLLKTSSRRSAAKRGASTSRTRVHNNGPETDIDWAD